MTQPPAPSPTHAFDSFTGPGSLRFPAPDVARGFMLLLIAVANIPWWMPATSATWDRTGIVDQIWLLIRSGLVDARAYPLFSALFGFGLMTMINRRVIADVNRGIHPYWAYDSARKLIRRRGWWMLLFGFVHALIFPGDIIGTYALFAVIFAEVIAYKKYRMMAWIGGAVLVLASAFAVFAGGGTSLGGAGIRDTLSFAGAFTPLVNVFAWAVSTPATLLLSTVMPAAFIGARLGDTDILANPARYRAKLALVAAGGLGFAFLGSLPQGLYISGFVSAAPAGWTSALDQLAGLAGALGWLALLTLFAGNPPADGRLTGVRRMLSSIGRRSMTAYVTQSILFLAIFAVLRWTGWTESLTAAGGALLAFGVWLVIGLACQLLERLGLRGPLEVLLRRAVARSGR